MRGLFGWRLLVAGLLASGSWSCAETPGVRTDAEQVLPPARAVTPQGVMVLLPTVASGGLALQALVTPWSRQDIHHLVLRLSVLSGIDEQPVRMNGEPVQRVVHAAQLADPVAFRGLRPRMTYRVRAYAYRTEQELPESLISVDDPRSWADVVIDREDRPVVTLLPVKLRDTVFSGEATAGIRIEEGTYTTTQETLS